MRGLKTESANQRKGEENKEKRGTYQKVMSTVGHSSDSKLLAQTTSKYYTSIAKMNQFEIAAFFAVILLYNISVVVYILNLHQHGKKNEGRQSSDNLCGKNRRSTVGPDEKKNYMSMICNVLADNKIHSSH